MKPDPLKLLAVKVVRVAALCLGLVAFPAVAATVNITASVTAGGWAVGNQFIGQVDLSIPAIEGYDINLGDTVNLDIDFAGNESLKLTSAAGISSIAFLLERNTFSLYTIENISVSLDNFVTDSTWNGVFSRASADQSGFGLGPGFLQTDVGVLDGEYIQFSGFQASFTLTAGDPGNDEFLYTAPGLSNWTVDTVSAVPIPAAAWLFGSALVGLGVFKRRK